MSTNPDIRLLNHLPAIYHVEEDNKDLHILLSAIEAVLFGADEWGLENEIAAISSLFDPLKTDKDFIPWLAKWVALSHLGGLSERQQRNLIAGIMPQYAKRGTREYLEWFLEFFTPPEASVVINEDVQQGLVVGSAKLGLDTILEHDAPFLFAVTIRVPGPGLTGKERERQKQDWEHRARQVIDLAKPAHTRYQLDWEYEGG